MSEITKKARERIEYGSKFEVCDLDEPWIFAALDVVDAVARLHGKHRSLENCAICWAVDKFKEASDE